jgi:hypothetical protein
MYVVIHRHGRNYGTTPPHPYPFKLLNHLNDWNYQKGIGEREMFMEEEGQTVWEPKLSEMKAEWER